MRELTFAIDRRGGIDVTGLPVCGNRILRRLDTSSVEAACGPAIVGRGLGKVLFAYPGNTPIPVTTELQVFNGGTDRGVTTLFVRGVVEVPISKSIVTPVRIEKVSDGRFGLVAKTRIPVLGEGYGHVTDFWLRIAKRYRADGTRRSVLSAICNDGKLQANGRLILDDRVQLVSQLIRPCIPDRSSP